MTVTGLGLSLLVGCAPDAPESALVVWIADLEGQELIQVDRDDPVNTLSLDFRPSAVLPRGEELLVADFDSGRVVLLDTSGQTLETWHQNSSGASDFRLEEPCSLLRDGQQVLALGNDTRNVLVLEPGQGAVDELGGYGTPPVRGAHDLALDEQGLLHIAGSPVFREQGLIQVWDFELGLVDSLAPWGVLQDATGLSIGPDGELLVVDWWGEQLALVEGQEVTPLVGSDWLSDPVAVRHAPDGTVVVLDREGLLVLAPTALPRRIEVEGLLFPRGLALGDAGLVLE